MNGLQTFLEILVDVLLCFFCLLILYLWWHLAGREAPSLLFLPFHFPLNLQATKVPRSLQFLCNSLYIERPALPKKKSSLWCGWQETQLNYSDSLLLTKSTRKKARNKSQTTPNLHTSFKPQLQSLRPKKTNCSHQQKYSHPFYKH